MEEDFSKVTIQELEEKITRIYELEGKPDELFRLAIFMGQLEFAKHFYHNKDYSPQTRLHKGGSRSAEISSFGQALAQLLLLIRTRKLDFSKVFNYAVGHLMEEDWKDRKHSDELIGGIPVTGGKVMGKAYVITENNPLDRLPEGSILVIGHADSKISDHLNHAKAVVTDQGSSLCHMAIVARELGMPAVVGTGNATQHIRTGDMLSVDADEGTVTISGK